MLIVVLFPWEAYTTYGFSDIVNYLERIDLIYYQQVYQNIEISGIVYAIFNEVTWLFVLTSIADFGANGRLGLQVISAACAFVFFFFTSRKVHFALALLIMVNPILIDLLMSQVRSALAFTVALTGLLLFKSTSTRFLLMLFAATIHTSMLIVGLIYLAGVMLSRLNASFSVKIAISAIVCVIAFLFIAILGAFVLDFADDRRSLDEVGRKGTMFMLPWFLLLVALAFSMKSQASKSWEYFYTILVLGIVIPLEFFVGHFFRIIAFSIPIIFITTSNLQRDPFVFIVAGTLCYNALLFYYWLG